MREAVRRLYLLLDAVPAASRAAFLLHVVDGRSLAEVAEMTGTTTIATKLRVWRTRQRIEVAALRDPLLAPFVDRRRHPTRGEEEDS
jgi:DNA-directed RNA polymerase specialized sigma24 family protein